LCLQAASCQSSYSQNLLFHALISIQSQWSLEWVWAISACQDETIITVVCFGKKFITSWIWDWIKINFISKL
jgi:hypothetical protein